MNDNKKPIIDVSKYQGNIAWAKIRDVIAFAIIRVQDNTILDKKLARNIKGAEENDVPYGVYAFFRAKTEAEARDEAKRFFDRAMQALADPTIWYIDVETKTAKWATQRKAILAYADELRKQGACKVGIYSYDYMYKVHLKRLAPHFDDVWLARYGTKKQNLRGVAGKWPSSPCGLHQYTSCGDILGIPNRVDLNRLTGDKPLSFYTDRHDAPTADFGDIEVTGLTVRVRSGPGTNYPTIGIVVKGTILDRTGDDSSGWFGVEYNGVSAFIGKKYTRSTDDDKEVYYQ